MTRVLIVSNGYGEDWIGRQLARALLAKGVKVAAFPLVGDGTGYRQDGIEVRFKNRTMPSGGFLRNWRDILADIGGGTVGQAIRQLRALAIERRESEIIVAVGDVFCLLMATGVSGRRIYFLPTAKSDLFMPHSAIEYGLIRRFGKLSFPRDELTCRAFLNHRIAAQWHGNVMMDQLIPSPPPQICAGKIALLPGSRAEAFGNLTRILEVVERLRELDHALTFEVALAPQLDRNELGEYLKSSRWRIEKGTITDGTLSVIISAQFLETLCSSVAVIGLAGTANEQAAFLGRPVFCFEGTGPQSTAQRFTEQSNLMQGGIQFLTPFEPHSIAKTILNAVSAKPIPSLPKNQDAAPRIATTILESA